MAKFTFKYFDYGKNKIRRITVKGRNYLDAWKEAKARLIYVTSGSLNVMTLVSPRKRRHMR